MQGGYPIGELTAELRRNSPGASSPFTLFRAESTVDRVPGPDVRAGFAVTRTLMVEASGAYMTPDLTIRISEDAEGAADALARERLEQYTVDVTALFLIPGVNLANRARPYVLGGGGYLRQLHEGRLRLETGRTWHMGGGLHYWLRGATGRQRPIGARLEARFTRRTRGIDFDERARIYPSASALLFVGF
jgi:hypothetical protein